MATPSKEGKTLVEHNVRNVVYGDDSGVYPCGYATKISLEKNSSTKDIYGDGELQLTIIKDKGLTGSLGLTAQDADMDKYLGFAMELAAGTANIQVTDNKVIAIGYESYLLLKDGTQKTKKTWLYGVTVSPATESLTQDEEDISTEEVSYEFTATGTNLKDNDGKEDYRDTNGNLVKVFKWSKLPSDDGYDTFLDTVPVPIAKIKN